MYVLTILDRKSILAELPVVNIFSDSRYNSGHIFRKGRFLNQSCNMAINCIVSRPIDQEQPNSIGIVLLDKSPKMLNTSRLPVFS